MKADNTHRLSRRLWQAFVLQIVLISGTAVVGVYLAEFAIREILIVSALKRESEYFWARRRIDAGTPAPNTHSLIGYVFDVDAPETHPEEFSALSTGTHELTTPVGRSVVHVTEADGKRLYLVFDAENLQQLATYFGVVPLALMLVVLYSSAWVAYRLSRRAVSPIVRLARSVSDINPGTTYLPQFDFTTSVDRADGEILILAQALDQLADRINRFVERERNFSREASHELRSPLTVIRIACDTLLSDDDLPETSKTSIDRIRRASHDMEELTQVLLLLAREDEGGLERESISVNEVIRQEVSKCELIYAPKNIDIWFVEEGELTLDASPRVVAILLGNVIRNACAYTDKGSVSVTIGDGVVTIEDSGVGISEVELKAVFERYYRVPNSRQSGHGIGLSLVKSLTERFDWPLTIESEPGFGTRVTVSFPASTFRPAAAGRAPVSAG